MGHLVNSRGLRLGWSQGWCDVLFSNKQYYCEYLYSSLRIRFYLIYSYFSDRVDKQKVIYSHFYIINFAKLMYINLFFYDTTFEEGYSNLLHGYRDELKGILRYSWRRESRAKYKFKRKFSWINPKNDTFTTFKLLKRETRWNKSFNWFKKKKDLKNIKRLLEEKKSLTKDINKFKHRFINRSLMKPVFKYTFMNVYKLFSRSKIFLVIILLKSLLEISVKDSRRFFGYDLLYLVYAIVNLDIPKVKSILIRFVKSKTLRLARSRVLFLCSVFIKFMANNNNSIFDFFREYMQLIYFGSVVGPYYKHSALLVQFVCSLLTNVNNITVKYYLISNDGITSDFLSRYIAKKLNQNLSVRGVLNPLRREFGNLFRFASFSPLNKWYRSISVSTSLNKRKVFVRGAWKNLLILFVKNYNFLNKDLFINSFVWLSLDSLIMLSWFNDNFSNKRLISFSKKFFNKRSFFVSLFFYSFLIISYHKLYWLDTKVYGIKQKNIDFSNLLDPIFFDLFIGRFGLFNNYNFLKGRNNIIGFLATNLNKYLNYSYFAFSYKSHWIRHNHLNNLKLRNVFKAKSIFTGFKIHCSGRFSRRQRARSYWFSKGKVPLNTISSPIDYGFFTMPIKNSAISVKVWLNRNNLQSVIEYFEVI